MSNPDIAKWASVGGKSLAGRPQDPEHVQKRIAAMKATLASQRRTCPQCKTLFEPESGPQRYCSGLCRKRAAQARGTYSTRFSQKLPGRNKHYKRLAAGQGERCAICGWEPDPQATGQGSHGRLCVDHCHESGTVRGLLCNDCNRAIGAMRDDPERLESAATYLRRC